MEHHSIDNWAETKTKWTGKSVRVNSTQPEYFRFADKTGNVITVNQNGMCLVDFHDGGWYDIEPEALFICDITDQPHKQVISAVSSIPVRQK